jgi:hypothetical protein
MFKSKSIFLKPFEKESHIYIPSNNVVDWYDYVWNRMRWWKYKNGYDILLAFIHIFINFK